jgi:type IV pilus assembly protein PilN
MTAIRINLLPHRQLRKARQQRWLIVLAATIAGSAVAVVLVGQAYLVGLKSEQLALNDKLVKSNIELDKKITVIANLKNETKDLLDRKEVVESLQNNRSETVRMFDILMRSLPDGLYLKILKQTGDTIALGGYAQSNERVSAFMSTLNNSDIFDEPVLIEVKSAMVGPVRSFEFSLMVKITRKTTRSESDLNKKAGT